MNISDYILAMLKLAAWRRRQLRRDAATWRELMEAGGTVKKGGRQ